MDARKILLVFFMVAALGFIVSIASNSTIASCFSAVVVMAAAVAALFTNSPTDSAGDKEEIKFRVTIGFSRNTNIIGVALKSIRIR